MDKDLIEKLAKRIKELRKEYGYTQDDLSIKAGIELLGNKLGNSVIVLASERMVIAKVSENFVQKGVNAGKIVGEIAKFTGANGGGRPNFAQGGVKDSSKLDEILEKIEKDIKN